MSAVDANAKARNIAGVPKHKVSESTARLISTGASDPWPSSSGPSARNAQLPLTRHDSLPCCPPVRFPSRAAAAAAAPPLVPRFTRGGRTADPPLPRVPAPAGALSSRSPSRSPWRRAGGRSRRRRASSGTWEGAPCCWALLPRKAGGCSCCPPPLAWSQVACARRGVSRQLRRRRSSVCSCSGTVVLARLRVVHDTIVAKHMSASFQQEEM